jgi:hypothetical protein
MNRISRHQYGNHLSRILKAIRNNRLLSFMASLCLSGIVVLMIAYLYVYVVLGLVNADYGYVIHFYGLPFVMGIVFIVTIAAYHKIYILFSSYRLLYEAGIVNGGLFAVCTWTIPSFYLMNSRPTWLTTYIENWTWVILSCWLITAVVSGLIFIPLQRYSTSNMLQK